MNVKSKVRARFAVESILVFTVLIGLAVWAFDWNNPERRRHQLLEAIKLVESEQNGDAQKAFSIALKLADSGDRNAKVFAAILLTHAPSPLERDEKRGREFYIQASNSGSPMGCRMDSRWKEWPERDIQEAACGDANSQAMMGIHALGTKPPNHAVAASYFEASAANGDSTGLYFLGRMYALGIYYSKDIGKGKQLLRQALDLGDANAGEMLYDLDVYREFSVDGKRFIKESGAYDFEACHLAAELGSVECQLDIGLNYKYGSLAPKDLVAAYKWLNLAASGSWGDHETGRMKQETTRRIRDRLEREMTLAQIEEAQRLSRDWKPRKIRKPEQPPLIAVLQELRDEMDGKFPTVPKIPAQTASLSSTPKAGTQTSNSLPRERSLTGDEKKAVIPGGDKTVDVSKPLSPSSKSGPEIAAMEPVERKVAREKLIIELVSQSLCGSIVKNRLTLSGQTGLIHGCKKRQQGGRSSIMVDNTANDTAVLVKLYPFGNPDAAAARVFSIRAKDSWTENNIRAGTYELRYEDLSSGAFTKTEALTIDEQRVDGGVKFSRLTVTLFKVQNGNMKTQPIAKNEFED